MKKMTMKRAELRQEVMQFLGEGIHTAFRKATDCKQAHPIWKLIQKMPQEHWHSVLEFIADPLIDFIQERS